MSNTLYLLFQIVISECNLLEYLGMLLVTCKHKKFRMEACQIISNIAVRNKTSIEVGLLFNDVRHKTSMEVGFLFYDYIGKYLQLIHSA